MDCDSKKRINLETNSRTVVIRYMARRDMRRVLEIESACFEYPWSEAGFIAALRQRNCIGKVAECGERVVAYVIYELSHHCIDVENLAVDPSFQRQGIGTMLIEHLAEKLTYQRRRFLNAPVRESNLSAQLFFRDLGFKAVSISHHYYDDSPDESMIEFVRRFCDHPTKKP